MQGLSRHTVAGAKHLLLWAALSLSALPSIAEEATKIPTGPAPSWIEPVSAPASEKAAEDTPILYHLREIQYNAGTTEEYRHTVKELVNPTAVKDSSEVSVWFNPDYQKLTFHHVTVTRNGVATDRLDSADYRLIEEEDSRERHLYEGGRTALLILHDIQAGDVLDIAFTIQGANPIFGDHFSETVYVASHYPIRKFFLRVLGAPHRTIAWKSLEGAPAMTEAKSAGGLQDLRLTQTDVDPFLTDSDLPRDCDPSPRIQFSDWSSWKEVDAWARNVFEPEQKFPESLRAVADAVRAKDDPALRAVGALRHIQKSIRYLGVEIGEHSHKPYPLEIVAQRGYGDCKDKANLLAAFLRELGLEAWPALVSTYTTPEAMRSSLPSPGRFNHAVVLLNFQGKDHWLDPTESLQGGPLNQVYFPDYGYALVLREGQTDLTRITPAGLDESSKQVDKDYVFDDYSGSGRLTVHTILRGSEADDSRAYFESTARKEIEKQYVEYYTRQFSSVVMSAPMRITDDTEKNERIIDESYTLSKAWRPSDRSRNLSATFSPDSISHILVVPQTRQRTQPSISGGPTHITEHLHITMPEDWVFGPVQSEVHDPAFDFKLESTPTANKIAISYLLDVKKDRIEAGRTDEFATRAEKINDQSDYTIWISRKRQSEPLKKPTPAPQEKS